MLCLRSGPWSRWIFHEKRMLVPQSFAMNVDFVCRHDALFIANLA